MASQSTGDSIVYSTVCPGPGQNQKKSKVRVIGTDEQSYPTIYVGLITYPRPNIYLALNDVCSYTTGPEYRRE